MDIQEILRAKDAKASYPLFLELEKQAMETPALITELPLFFRMLSDPSSYVRVRGFRMICACAGWDTGGVIAEHLPAILGALEDPKPTALRQYLAALPRLLAGRPELGDAIRQKLRALDFSGYRDSMQSLLRRDVARLLQEG